MQLIPFDQSHAALVLSWPRTPQELSYWAALSETPPLTIFGEWLADPDSYGWLLVSDVPVAYGELWVSEADDEVELAHILVSPHHRNQGVGRKLVRLLVEEAIRFGVSTAWVRVVPENQAAIRCYSAVGFALSLMINKQNLTLHNHETTAGCTDACVLSERVMPRRCREMRSLSTNTGSPGLTKRKEVCSIPCSLCATRMIRSGVQSTPRSMEII